MYKIEVKHLQPNKKVIVRGKVVFSRITSQIAGQELIDANQKAMARGMKPTNKPYTELTINNAQVLILDPSRPTLEEQYAQQKLYITKGMNTTDKTARFTQRNSGKFLPIVAVKDVSSNTYNVITPEAELAIGLDVTLICNTFKTKFGTGISLDQVLVNEPIRYYQPQNNDLAAYGLNIQGNIQRQVAPSAPQALIQPVQHQGYPQGYINPPQQEYVQPFIPQGNTYPQQQNGIHFDLNQFSDPYSIQ